MGRAGDAGPADTLRNVAATRRPPAHAASSRRFRRRRLTPRACRRRSRLVAPARVAGARLGRLHAQPGAGARARCRVCALRPGTRGAGARALLDPRRRVHRVPACGARGRHGPLCDEPRARPGPACVARRRGGRVAIVRRPARALRPAARAGRHRLRERGAGGKDREEKRETPPRSGAHRERRCGPAVARRERRGRSGADREKRRTKGGRCFHRVASGAATRARETVGAPEAMFRRWQRVPPARSDLLNPENDGRTGKACSQSSGHPAARPCGSTLGKAEKGRIKRKLLVVGSRARGRLAV